MTYILQIFTEEVEEIIYYKMPSTPLPVISFLVFRNREKESLGI